MSTAAILSRANDLLASHDALLARTQERQRANRRALRSFVDKAPASLDTSSLDTLLNLPLINTPEVSRPSSPTSSIELAGPSRVAQVVHPQPRIVRQDLPAAKKARCARYANYVPEEETIRNDYSQHYVDSGEWPQNWIVGAEMECRFEEYPKQQRLLALKKASVAEYALSPTFLSMSSSKSMLQGLKFDSILIDPPFSSSFTWEQLEALPIQQLAADPSFIFLWVGSGAGDGLERGREILGKWGYRRCEDIVWIKTNKTTNKGYGTDPPTTSLLTRTKQHCLMGIRGTVRRSTDNWFVHCNIDTDVILWEGDPTDPTRKPPEMYQLIENFCLGTRRLELFGRYHSLRRGWVTVTSEDMNLTAEEAKEKDGAIPFQRETWEARLKELAQAGKFVVPNSTEIESLRPKSPTQRGSNANNVSVSAVPMSSAPSNLPNNPIRNASAIGGSSGGATSGGVPVGLPKPPMNMGMTSSGSMNMLNAGGMGPGGMNMGGGMSSMSAMPGMAPAGSMNPGMNWQGGGTANNMIPRIGSMPSHMPQMNAMSGGQGMFNPAFDGSAMNAGGIMGMQPGFDMGVINQGMGGVHVPAGVLGMEQMSPAMMGGNPQLGFGFDGGQGGWMGSMDGGMGQSFMGSNGVWDNNGNFVGNGAMGNQSGTGAAFGPGMRQWRNF